MKIKQKDMNLYYQYLKKDSGEYYGESNLSIWLIVLLSVILISSVTFSVRFKYMNLEHKTEVMNEQVDALCKSDDFKKLSDMNDMLSSIDDVCFDISSLMEYSDEYYIDIPKDFFEKMYYYSGSVKILNCSYKSSNHSFSIEAEAFSVSDITEFINKLREYELCEKVEYSGYNVSGEEYSFSAVCIFAGNEELSEENEEVSENE